MNLCKKINNRIVGFLTSRYVKAKSEELLETISKGTNKPRIYFFCTPMHSNLGDQAQFMCWLRLFKQWYPDYEVVCVPTRCRKFKMIRTIRENLKDNDLIFIHSGYLIFDPHPELPFILDVVRAFYDKPITILPQTVNLMDEWYRQVVSRSFNAHPNLTLICRDEVSLEKSKELFPNVKLRLLPDVVTSLIGDSEFQYKDMKRDGVLLCVRNDGEKLYSDGQINELRSRFNGVRTELYDTTIKVHMWEWDKKRELLISDVVKKFSSYRLIITDRYHGTIFSQIANTPVIVLNSTDHKLSSGVKWFPKDVFGRMVTYSKDLEDAYAKATEVLHHESVLPQNPAYFKNTFYNKPL